MSSLPVAAQRRASPRLPLGLVALVVVLAIGVGAFVSAMAITNRAAPAPSAATSTVKQPSAVSPKAEAAAVAAQLANYRELVAKLGAARAHNDIRSVYRIDRALDAALTPTMIGLVFKEHARLASNLESAYQRHDMRAQALISRQVQALCGQPDVQSRLPFCN
jgi:hypothetical protein